MVISPAIAVKMTEKTQTAMKAKLQKLELPLKQLEQLMPYFARSKNKYMNEILYFDPRAPTLSDSAIKSIDDLITVNTSVEQVKSLFLSSIEGYVRQKEPVFSQPKDFKKLERDFYKTYKKMQNANTLTTSPSGRVFDSLFRDAGKNMYSNKSDVY